MDDQNRTVFDIEMREVGYGLYLVQASSPDATFEGKLRLAPDDEELQFWIRDAQTGRTGAQSRVGERLFQGLFEPVPELWDEIRAAAEDAGPPLVRVHSSSPELAALPWELMVDRQGVPVVAQAMLVRSAATTTSVATPAWRPSGPLRVLFAGASPSDYPPDLVEAEKKTVHHALSSLTSESYLDARILEHANVEELRHLLQRERLHIFHFVGHTYEDPYGRKIATGQQQGSVDLVFESDWGSEPVAALDLFSKLSPADGPPLFILGTERMLPALSTNLIERGLASYVLSYRLTRDDGASRGFWRRFYEMLAAQVSPAAALFDARRMVMQRFTQSFVPDWANLMLTAPAGDADPMGVAGDSYARGGDMPANPDEPSTADVDEEVNILKEQQKEIERMMDFYGGKGSAPEDLTRRWEALAQRIRELGA